MDGSTVRSKHLGEEIVSKIENGTLTMGELVKKEMPGSYLGYENGRTNMNIAGGQFVRGDFIEGMKNGEKVFMLVYQAMSFGPMNLVRVYTYSPNGNMSLQ